jgi:hypothetical protein
MKRVESVATAIQFSCTGHVAQRPAYSQEPGPAGANNFHIRYLVTG